MNRMARLAAVFCAGLGLLAVGEAAPFKTDHVTAELVAEHSAVHPGQALHVGLKIRHQPHWHTYWRNPGDSGLPTTVDWNLPTGAQVGEIQWPVPRRLPVGPLVNYGYEADLLLPQRLQVPARAQPGSTLVLRAQANWLVCREVCIPEGAQLELRLPVVAPEVVPGSTEHLPVFERLAAEQPRPLSGWRTRLQHAGSDLLLTLDAPVVDGASASTPASGDKTAWPTVHVFPYAEQVLVPASHEVYRTPGGYAVKLALMDGASLPARMSGLVVAQTAREEVAPPFAWSAEDGARRGGEFTAAVETVPALQWPEGARKLTGPAQGGAELLRGAAASAGGWAWLATLGLALLGGLLLNLMPCVFPVLSIKLLSLAHQPEADGPRARRLHALAYAAGVVLSFLGLAAALLVLRAAGQAVGWGFQLQEPHVVLGLAMLFFALGLNLLGGFEWGAWLPAGLAQWRSRRPSLDAFMSGSLAVVAASPCTAPFMGAALGYAVTQSAASALAVFAMLGLGMALPYAALVVMPGWRGRLPRPGAWMQHLKQLLAFPMFLTVLWLLWVLGHQAGIDGVAKAGLCLVALAFGAWLQNAGRRRPGWSRAAALLVWGGALAGTLPFSGDAPSSASPTSARPAGDPTWAAYEPAQVSAHLAQGRAVFVDFTAAWCVSCQVNKRLVLDSESGRQAFARAGVALMRADWTNRDPRITQALAELGRSGVPVYVLHRPGKAPLLLPEVLTPGLLEEALGTL